MVIRLREARNDDMFLIFNWTNEKTTRLVSFNSEPIQLEVHKKWFNNILNDGDTYFFIAEETENNLPVGQLRINREGTVSICIGEEFRGRKYATSIIQEAIKFIKYSVETLDIDYIYAYIKEDNVRSIKSFERAEFECLGMVDFNGHECLKYAYNLNT